MKAREIKDSLEKLHAVAWLLQRRGAWRTGLTRQDISYCGRIEHAVRVVLTNTMSNISGPASFVEYIRSLARTH